MDQTAGWERLNPWGSKIRQVSDERIWRMRTDARNLLIDYGRERLALQLATAGAAPEEVAGVRRLFDRNALTLGFARRFATYKRPNLLLKDPERLLRLLTNRRRPMQLIVAGKAHPEDRVGQALIQEWMNFIRRPEARPYVMFLSDYDMLLTEHLIQGVDLWINTPRRPWEACGTSGMKVLVNGGLNMSELDGWWAEAYGPEVGWALGDGREHGDDAEWDAIEAAELYDLLEHKVIPEFYTRNEMGVPVGWVSRIRESMARLTPSYSADRAVREYTEQHYVMAATVYRERTANNGAGTADWLSAIKENWHTLRFGEMTAARKLGKYMFEVQVYLSELDPEAVRVELFAEGIGDGNPVTQVMTRLRQLTGTAGGFVYGASIADSRPASDYTARVIPYRPGVAVPLETSQILWQR